MLIKLSKSSAMAFPITAVISMQLKTSKPTLHQSLPVVYRWGISRDASWGRRLLSMSNRHQPQHQAWWPQSLSPRNASRGSGSTAANILHNIILVDKVLADEVGDAGSSPVSSWGDLSHISQEHIHQQLKVKLRELSVMPPEAMLLCQRGSKIIWERIICNPNRCSFWRGSLGFLPQGLPTHFAFVIE